MPRKNITNEITMDYRHKSIDEVTTEEVQIRESWYNSQVQRHYTSTISIKGKSNWQYILTNQVPLPMRSEFIVIPGTGKKYQCRITRESNDIVVAFNQRHPDRHERNAICPCNIIIRDPSGMYIPASTVSQGNPLNFSEASEYRPLDFHNPTWFPSLKTILDNESVNEHGYFYLTIQLWGPEDCGSQANNPPHPFGVMLEMANQFTNPIKMDDTVEFQCPNNRDGKLKKLYAWAPILSSRSEYFKTMFESGFSEGTGSKRKSTENSNMPNKSCPSETKLNSSTDGKRYVVIEDDYDLFHNVLYYIYTNRITFSTDLTVEPVNSTTPRLCETEDIYGMADKMFLDDLKFKAHRFIAFTCTVENITERLFSSFGCLHKDIGDMYALYFQKNFEDIGKTKEYRRFFKELEAERDSDEIVRVFNRYREVMVKVDLRQDEYSSSSDDDDD